MASCNLLASLLDLNTANSPSKRCFVANCLVRTGFHGFLLLILIASSSRFCYFLCFYLLLPLLLLSTCHSVVGSIGYRRHCPTTNQSQQLRAKLRSNINSSSGPNCSYHFILLSQKLPLSVIIDLLILVVSSLVVCVRTIRSNRLHSSEKYLDQLKTPHIRSRLTSTFSSSTKYTVIQDQACTLFLCNCHTYQLPLPPSPPVRVSAVQFTRLLQFQLAVTDLFGLYHRSLHLCNPFDSVAICRCHRERQIYRWLTTTLTAMSCNNSLYKKNGSSSSSSSSNISSTGTSGGSSNESGPSSGSSSSSHHYSNNSHHHHQQHYCYNSYFVRDNSSANNRKGCDLYNKDDEIRRVYIRPPPNRHACEAHSTGFGSSVKSSSICSLSSSSPSSSSSTPSAFGASPFTGSSSSLSSSSMGPASSSRKWSPFSSNGNSKR